MNQGNCLCGYSINCQCSYNRGICCLRNGQTSNGSITSYGRIDHSDDGMCRNVLGTSAILGIVVAVALGVVFIVVMVRCFRSRYETKVIHVSEENAPMLFQQSPLATVIQPGGGEGAQGGMTRIYYNTSYLSTAPPPGVNTGVAKGGNVSGSGNVTSVS
eukprot:TRINITY_DN1606_c0_g1_i1.p1 TRINITY_DN1606_c0_g1~~TRINITY_DN1606_c0_g1_i1.p1  ORF type:complete len:181 (+),score=23.07 TRINITY_DN1606_c0_g1_i1:69-545(+)